MKVVHAQSDASHSSPITVDIHDINIGRSSCHTLLQNSETFVNESVEASLDDFLVAYISGSNALCILIS
jgi:hypothetical protein